MKKYHTQYLVRCTKNAESHSYTPNFSCFTTRLKQQQKKEKKREEGSHWS